MYNIKDRDNCEIYMNQVKKYFLERIVIEKNKKKKNKFIGNNTTDSGIPCT